MPGWDGRGRRILDEHPEARDDADSMAEPNFPPPDVLTDERGPVAFPEPDNRHPRLLTVRGLSEETRGDLWEAVNNLRTTTEDEDIALLSAAIDDLLMPKGLNLSESGLLWLINRVVFHPRGFALAYLHSERAFSLLGDGSEPWRFEGVDEDATFQRVENLFDDRRLKAVLDPGESG